jgi:hypothetical protein
MVATFVTMIAGGILWPAPGCLVLSCLFFLSCLVLSYLVLSCLVLSCLVLSCLVLSCFVIVLWSLLQEPTSVAFTMASLLSFALWLVSGMMMVVTQDKTKTYAKRKTRQEQGEYVRSTYIGSVVLTSVCKGTCLSLSCLVVALSCRCLVLSCLVMSLSCLVLSCLVVVLSCRCLVVVLSCLVLSCLV